MNVFISWSSDASEAVAISLRSFLVEISDNWKPWVSAVDISAGAAWRADLNSAINDSGYGIVCATSRSMKSPWVLFETGALSVVLENSRICPYLLDSSPEPITGPLQHFQSKKSNLEGTKALLVALQKACPDIDVPGNVDERVASAWPALEASILEARHLLESEIMPPEYNRIDNEGLRALLSIHFAASAGDLTFILDKTIDNATNKKKVKKKAMLDELAQEAIPKIQARRTLLTHFYSDQFGIISDMLEEFFPVEDVRRWLEERYRDVMKSSNPKRAAFNLIKKEQAKLEAIVAERLR